MCTGVCVCLCCATLDAKMAVVPGKNKLKMGSAGRYYSAYLIYDVANSCLAALHAKMPPPVVVTRTNPPSPMHVQNPRKFSSLSVFYFPWQLLRQRECVTSKTNPVASYVSTVRILPLCRNYQGNSSRKETIGRLFRDKERVSFRVMTALSEVYAAILYLIEKSWI